ncbi:hypothetical protein ABZ543_08455 [Streptomyces roseifaciens]
MTTNSRPHRRAVSCGAADCREHDCPQCARLRHPSQAHTAHEEREAFALLQLKWYLSAFQDWPTGEDTPGSDAGRESGGTR